MSTAREIRSGCDAEMLHAVRSGRADPRLVDAFRRQLVGGMAKRLIGERVERQEDFTQAHPVVDGEPGQLSLF